MNSLAFNGNAGFPSVFGWTPEGSFEPRRVVFSKRSIGDVLGASGASEICPPIIPLIPVGVINVSGRPLSFFDQPSDAMVEVEPTINLSLAVSLSRWRSCQISCAIAASTYFPTKFAALEVV
jgi:hypothetical protein